MFERNSSVAIGHEHADSVVYIFEVFQRCKPLKYYDLCFFPEAKSTPAPPYVCKCYYCPTSVPAVLWPLKL